MKGWRLILAALLLAGTASLAPSSVLAQDEPAAEADDETDPGLDKDDAELGRDIEESKGMKREDADRVFKLDMEPPEGASAEFVAELKEFQGAFARYASEIRDYQQSVDGIVEAEYARRVAQTNERYDSKIKSNEAIERQYRLDAIAVFEAFLVKYPDEERYTPDGMFRLAELYFEKANDDFLLADEAYQNQLAAYENGEIADPPAEPERDYAKTVGTFRRLIDDWPAYRLLDGAYYLLAYCELQMGNDALARDLFAELIVKRPQSKFVPEAWVRIGEYHFDYNDLDLARAAYQKAMEFPDSPYFDKALYKLAWTYYRQDDFDQAIKQFKRLVEYSDDQERKTGKSGSVLREESVQYIAISLAEEDWDLDGNKDEDFGIVRVQRYISGDKPYEREVLAQLGDYLFDNTRYQDAIDIFNFVIRKYPLDRKNPELHEKIILALLRDERLDQAFAERSKLSGYYGSGSDWWRHQQKVGNAEAVRYAENLVKDNLIQSATWYHAEAQKLRNEAQVTGDPEKRDAARDKYAVAAVGYADFLKKYPNDKDFYQWNFYHAECLYYSAQFEPAFEQYRVVREMDVAKNEYQEVAAFNAVKALEFRLTELVERGKLPSHVLPRGGLDAAREAAESQETAREDVEDRGDQKRVVKALPVPELVMNYVTAMDRYVVLGLKNEEDKYLDAKFAFQSAKIFYDYKDFATARKRFDWIINNYPENEVAYLAGSLIIETYREENDFAGLAAAADRLGNVIKGEQAAAIKAEVKTLQLGALFKSAEQLFAEKKYEEAAAKYVQLLKENPETEYAAKALNNAAVAYENVRRFESAMKLYERVYKEHPKDPLAAYALYRVAVNQERFFDFDTAVQSYQLFHDKYRSKPQSDMDETGLDFDLREKRGAALLSSAVLLENMQQYTSAAKAYERFAQEFPDDDQAPDASWQAALVWEKAKNKKSMIAAIERFNRTYGGNPKYDVKVLTGLDKVADYHEGRRDKRAADKIYRRIIEEYRARRLAPGSEGAFFAAKSEFMLVEREYAEWAKIEIKGSLSKQKKLLKTKVDRQKELNVRYEDVWVYNSLEWTMASSYRKGKMLQQFATSLYEVPIPFREDSEQYEVYRTTLEDIAIPLEDKAIEAYEKTIAKARDEKIVNEWTKRTLEELNKYKPAEYPLYKEEKRSIEYRRITGGDFIDAGRYQRMLNPPDPVEEK